MKDQCSTFSPAQGERVLGDDSGSGDADSKAVLGSRGDD